MARIADSQLEAIRQRVDIAELIREYVPELKRAGRGLKARCPFHSEKTPSFMVNSERQIFHCFGCQEGGDAFAFLMKMENLSFTEAVEKLAARAGVVIAKSAEALSPREKEFLRLREALGFAQEFYQRVLTAGPEADAARRYLDRRGLDRATRERFGLGFALADGSSFLDAALRKGFAPDILAKAGLVSMLEGSGRYRDYFRGRILYPIRSVKGEIVGFGARAMGDAMPKYLNSPDTAMFSKGRVLYGLFEGLGDIRKSRRVLLLEGYMDVLAMHQFGRADACAPLGTAVTPDHAALLKRYVDQVTLVFDPDEAGSAAALRGAELLLESGFQVRIATIPGGLDPDELLHKEGLPGFEKCLREARDLPDFQTERDLSKAAGPLSAEAKDRIAREVLATIAKAESDVLKSEWIRRLSQRLGVDEESLRSEMRRSKPRAAGAVRGDRSAGAAKSPEREPPAPLPPTEASILQTVLQRPSLSLDDDRVRETDFEHAGARRIFVRVREAAQREAEKNGAFTLSAFLESLTPEDAALARSLVVGEAGDGEDPARRLEQCVAEVRLLRRYWELHDRLHGSGGVPEDAMAPVVKEYHEVLRRLSELRLLDRLKDRKSEPIGSNLLHSGA